MRNPKKLISGPKQIGQKNGTKISSLICYAAAAEVALNSIFLSFLSRNTQTQLSFEPLIFSIKQNSTRILKNHVSGLASPLFFNFNSRRPPIFSLCLRTKERKENNWMQQHNAGQHTHHWWISQTILSPEPIKLCQTLLSSALKIGQPAFADAQRKLEGSHHR